MGLHGSFFLYCFFLKHYVYIDLLDDIRNSLCTCSDLLKLCEQSTMTNVPLQNTTQHGASKQFLRLLENFKITLSQLKNYKPDSDSLTCSSIQVEEMISFLIEKALEIDDITYDLYTG